MKNCKKIIPNLWNIYMLFTRDPYVVYMSKELEYYASSSMNLLGLISLDLTDNDYSVAIMSRDESKQYRAVEFAVSIETIQEARKWIDKNMGDIEVVIHDKSTFFNLFNVVANKKQLSNKFEILKNHISQLAAKEVIREIGYHYKDIDGNFIDQFQSKNGFDARFWELFLYCVFREEGFRFNRNSFSPDYMIEKFDERIAVEAVIISDKSNDNVSELLPKNDKEWEARMEKIKKKLENEMPLKFGSALFSKLQKKYWELDHVKDLPFIIAIADFHEFMSMTWSQSAIIDFLYGYRYDHKLIDNNLKIKPIKIDAFTKSNGVKIPAGFFNQKDVENISAILCSTTGTIGKFNRMGKQAGLGSEKSTIIRQGTCHNFELNAVEPNSFKYIVSENSNEKWTEGAILYHNPNAKIPINPNLFPSFAHYFLENKIVKSVLPNFFPYASTNLNMLAKDK